MNCNLMIIFICCDRRLSDGQLLLFVRVRLLEIRALLGG